MDYKHGGMKINTNQEDKNELITSLYVIRGKDDCQPPQGYEKIPVDLKKGSQGKYMYLCYKKGGSENPITDIIVRTSTFSGSSKDGYQGVASDFMASPTDLNKNRGGKYIYPMISRNSQYRPITSLKIGYGFYTTIQGYTKVEGDLNGSQGGQFVHLFIKRA